MRILHTESSCGWGGQELRILSEARGLIARGHEVSVLCPNASRIFREAPRHDVPVHALPIGRKTPGAVAALRRWLVRNRVDVINTHSSTDSWLAALACATLREAPPIVRTRHISAPIPDNPPTRWLYTRATACIVTTGEALRRQLIRDNRYPSQRIRSVPTGIDTGRFHPGDRACACRALGLDESDRHIGIVATLRSWKGHHHLIEAFASLHAPGWRLIIVGDGPRRDTLRDMLARAGLGERVIMAGQQDKPQLWLQALDVFCLPSYANEGVPQAILQAMLTGLPVVTTPVGSITEAVSDGLTGLIVSAQQPDELAAALRRLIDDPALRARVGTAAREEAVQRFGLAPMLDGMEQVFSEVAARAATARMRCA